STVDGSISVEDGGQLIIQDSEITGPVTTDPASVGSICGSHVDGRVTVPGTTAGVSVGDTTSGCDPSTIAGPPRITDTSGPVVVDRSDIAGRVMLSGNSSPMATVLSGLTVHGSLICMRNTATPTDSDVPLTVNGSRQGQCAP